MRLALDTNRYRDLADGLDEVVGTLEHAESVSVPFVVVAELRAGFAVGSKGKTNERTLQRFLAKPGISVLYADERTTRTYASLYRQLRAQGTPIPTNDLWIAALVLDHDLVLYSRDRHFEHLPQLRVL
ncbi:MAG: type II toxin-antitoxin system VapC family toxin [Sandaracinaceae bacterium]|nr:type II toxin-antitoxin system VapC family toxin [Sandaracinaceae bacterium]